MQKDKMLKFTYNGYHHNDLRYPEEQEVDGSYLCNAVSHAEYLDMQQKNPKKYPRTWQELPVCYYFGVDSSIVNMNDFTPLVHYLESNCNNGVSRVAKQPTAEEVGYLARNFGVVVLAAYLSAVPKIIEGFIN